MAKRYAESSFAVLAADVISAFEEISENALEGLSAPPPSPQDVLAYPTLQGIQHLGRIQAEQRQVLLQLSKEPAIARVVAMADGKPVTYFICRFGTCQTSRQLASYRAPIGRLAAMPIGDEMTAPNGVVLEVVEKAELRPAHDERGWDSRRSLIHRFSPPPIWIESLRELLATIDDAEDPLRSLLAAEQADHDAMARRRREVLTQMALRDQPILDQFQDEIFRLPLEDCLVLLGPPGTGKTTTLIRRLGQKLDLDALEDEERDLVGQIEQTEPNAIPHTASWLMFSPTELLRQYVKEAFTREGVPAPDANIRTWDEFRRELARGSLQLLRSAQRPQGLVMQRNDGYLMEATCDSVTGWYDDFERWQRHEFSSRRILANVEVLQGLLEGDALKRVEDLAASIDSVDPADVEALVRRLEGQAPSWAQMMESSQTSSRDIIRQRLTEHLRKDDGFLEGIADFLEALQEDGEESDDDGSGADDSDRDPDDEDEGAAVAHVGRLTRAQHAYQAAVRAEARAASLGRSLRKGSRSAALIDWIGNRGLSTRERERVGRNLRLASALRPLLNPVRTYTREVAARYQRFRRTRQSEGQWYAEGRVVRGEVGPLEVDMILLALLRFCREERQSRAGRRSLEGAFRAQLPTIPYRNQIFVDEATDFSPVQLACMLAVTHPGARSFFACGDFNQRLTAWGIRSEEEIEWARAQIPTMPPVGFRHLSTGYRHSPQLLDLARAIVRVSGEGGLEVELPDGATSAGFAPVLAEHTTGGAISNWIADRILEIERFGGELPSIAVLVPEEPQVGVMAKELGRAMAPHNVNVVACYAGQAIGQENDVRVFDAQHIKGLEFEAVFFADVDRLAELYPRLFTKFLYVGATRAATYFGLTSAGPVPSALAELRTIFATKFIAAEAYGNEGASNGNI